MLPLASADDLNAPGGEYQFTPLHHAIEMRAFAAAALLLEVPRVDQKRPDKMGRPPLGLPNAVDMMALEIAGMQNQFKAILEGQSGSS